jgi:hypothetical protein
MITESVSLISDLYKGISLGCERMSAPKRAESNLVVEVILRDRTGHNKDKPLDRYMMICIMRYDHEI